MKKELNKYTEKYPGLTSKEVYNSRIKYGLNEIEKAKKISVIEKILRIFKEPMNLLLLITASIYFIVGEYNDGFLMLFFVLVICAIEYLEENKTEKALEELNKLTNLNVTVIRNKKIEIISSKELVKGDIVLLEEGDCISADGKVLYSQTLGINESMLTGESDIIYKNINDDNINHFKTNMCYSGTNVVNGFGIIEITSIGKSTELGIIGKKLNEIKKEKTPLERQVKKLVFVCTIISLIVFVLTIIINYFNYSNLLHNKRIIKSLISGITIAMATIPEEIPVILTVFLAMGAWSLAKEKTLTKNMKSIETLGAINVLCTDKTGTITENKMVVTSTYEHSITFKKTASNTCSVHVFDPMELAIKNYFSQEKNNNQIIHEYPFTPKSKMTGILWNNYTLCIKGAPDNILPMCTLKEKEYQCILDKIKDYSQKGYRILAIAKKDNLKNIPENIDNLNLTFEGLIALSDPIRTGIKDSINKCNTAGIRVIMITGDSVETASTIAKNININNYNEVITGKQLENMTDKQLLEKIKTVNIFARVYPNHKMRIVESLQKNGLIVAMTGDGVNDAPALKKADIGISMGKRGTNVAKEASDIILLDDNFNTIVKAIENGRGIYENIKKAIAYIIIIHIPIALLALFVPIFKLPTLLKPVHIMLLELLIDPTSSIIFQKIKNGKEIMQKQPRNTKESLINKKTSITCILNGIIIFLVTFINYYTLIRKNIPINKAITITFTILVLSIIFVSFQLKSKALTIKTIIKELKNKTVVIINSSIIIFLLFLIYIPFFNNIANTQPINILTWIYIISISLLTVIPFDIIKLKKS